ncbi:MAG: hypothetical protein LLF86_06205 [Nitrospiraceae bacterium]|nr:hypothetical protein [Nitrospiraceae bacterium]
MPTAFAASPDAGTILREQTPQQQPTPPTKEGLPQIQKSEPAKKAGSTVYVKKFRITGATVLSELELTQILIDLVGQDLTMSDLEGAALRLARYYHSKGYLLASAIVPQQEVKDGIVTLQVIEGRLGEIKIEPGKRTSADTAKAWISASSSTGAIVTTGLERGLLLLGDQPEVQIKSTLTPGATPGASDLLVKVSDGSLVRAAVDFDTYGNRFTGRERGTARMEINNPSGRGDQAGIRYTAAEGLNYLRLNYSMPVGHQGLKIGAAYSYMDYELLKPFDTLNGKGNAHTFSVNAAYPVVRSQALNTWLTINYDYKRLTNKALDSKTSDKDVNVVTAGGSVDTADRFMGGGSNNLSFNYSAGDLRLSRVPSDADADASAAGTAGFYHKITYSISRNQQIVDNLTLFVAYSAQISFNNLDSSEKFSVGGPFGVRAYSSTEGDGDSGHMLTAELRWFTPFKPWGSTTVVSAFYDYARTTLHHKTWNGWQGSNASLKNSYDLQGAGLSFTILKANDFVGRAVAAWKVGHNNGTDTNGNDVEGRSLSGRFWFQLTKYFSFL